MAWPSVSMARPASLLTLLGRHVATTLACFARLSEVRGIDIELPAGAMVAIIFPSAGSSAHSSHISDDNRNVLGTNFSVARTILGQKLESSQKRMISGAQRTRCNGCHTRNGFPVGGKGHGFDNAGAGIAESARSPWLAKRRVRDGCPVPPDRSSFLPELDATRSKT